MSTQTPNKSDLDFFYTNASSLNNKLDKLKIFVELNKPYVIAITETHFTEISVPNIQRYIIYRRDRMKTKDLNKGGGVCIYVREDVESMETDISMKYDQNEHI
jgi:hypothetical protein